MPKVLEMKKEHLLKRFLGGPVRESDTVSGEEHASAVVAQPAMNEELLLGMLLKQRKELNKLLVLGRRPAARRNVHKMHAKSFYSFPFLFHRALVLSAKVNDSRDSKILELLQALILGLRAPVQKIVEFAEI